jgi:hypothetical protein
VVAVAHVEVAVPQREARRAHVAQHHRQLALPPGWILTPSVFPVPRRMLVAAQVVRHRHPQQQALAVGVVDKVARQVEVLPRLQTAC